MVVCQLPKLRAWVRFPSPAPELSTEIPVTKFLRRFLQINASLALITVLGLLGIYLFVDASRFQEPLIEYLRTHIEAEVRIEKLTWHMNGRLGISLHNLHIEKSLTALTVPEVLLIPDLTALLLKHRYQFHVIELKKPWLTLDSAHPDDAYFALIILAGTPAVNVLRVTHGTIAAVGALAPYQLQNIHIETPAGPHKAQTIEATLTSAHAIADMHIKRLETFATVSGNFSLTHWKNPLSFKGTLEASTVENTLHCKDWELIFGKDKVTTQGVFSFANNSLSLQWQTPRFGPGTLEAHINPNPAPTVHFNATASQVALQKLFPKQSRISLQGITTLTAVGTLPLQEKNNTTLNLQAHLPSGKIIGVDLPYFIQAAQASIGKMSAPTSPARNFTPLSNIEVRLSCHNNHCKHGTLTGNSDYLLLKGEGSFSPEPSHLDWRLEIVHPEEPDAIPLWVKITGPAESVTVQPDIEAYIKEYGSNKVNRALEKLKEKALFPR